MNTSKNAEKLLTGLGGDSLIYNGIDMSNHIRIIEVRGRGVTEQELITERVTASDVEYVTGRIKPPRFLEIDYEIRASNKEELRKRVDEVSEIISIKEQFTVSFKDELDRIYYCEHAGTVEGQEHPHVSRHQGTVVLLRDPYKYSKEEEETEIQDTTIVHNEGNEPVAPILELTAHKKATFIMVNNLEDEYNIIGYPLEEEGHEEVIEQKPVIFYEDGTSIDQWSYQGAKVDDYFNDITGTMTSDGAGIRAGNYGGAGDRMHGPAMITTLPTALTDFEIKTNFDIISRRVEDNFRIEVYLFDEGMNMLGKIGIKDNSRTQNRRAALGRVGPYRGAGRNNGYAIGKHNYIKEKLGETTLMHMSVKREGDLYTFYVGRYRNGRHQSTLTETYLDVKKEYDGKLKYIGLFIGNYKDRPVPNRLRMNNLEVTEIRQLTVDQTPYIIEEGDEIIIDHVTESVYINGVNYMPLRIAGSEFFHLPKGYSQLEINPPDTFSGIIKHREKYK